LLSPLVSPLLLPKRVCSLRAHLTPPHHTRTSPPLLTSCRFKRGGRGWDNPLAPATRGETPHAGARDELKSADRIRKERKEEERRSGFSQQAS
jgi:hypothetical protein